MKSDEERGPVALWLRNERLARGWTQKDVADRLGLTELSYRAYEAGPRVSKPVRTALEAIYGTKPPDPHAPSPKSADLVELVVALREQTAAIRELAEMMKIRESASAHDAPEVVRAAVLLRELLEGIQPPPPGVALEEGESQDPAAPEPRDR